MSALPENRNKLRQSLFRKLKRENAFWSYNPESVTLRNCDDDTLICKTLVHLDIKEINQLFSIFDIVMKGLSQHTEEILEQISKLECIKNYTLIGGTALALQLGHRVSWTFVNGEKTKIILSGLTSGNKLPKIYPFFTLFLKYFTPKITKIVTKIIAQMLTKNRKISTIIVQPDTKASTKRVPNGVE